MKARGIEKYYQDWESSSKLSALGLLNIQNYYDLEPKAIINGAIKHGEKILQSKTRLSKNDVLLIANEAKKHDRLDSYVNWMKAVNGLKKEYIIAAEEHDKALEDWVETISHQVKTLVDPIGINASDKAYEFRYHYQRERNNYCSDPTKQGGCYEFFMDQKKVQLCKEQGHSSQPKPENICFYLSYREPYLNLGPFKFEHLNTEPFIGIVHDVLKEDEIDNIIKDSKGLAKASYAAANGQYDKTYEIHTSKTAFLNYAFHSYLAKISRRLELASSLNIFNPRYRLTENYQVINYGLGGYITDHTDDAILPSRVAFEIGGGRIFTALLYLSDDVIGGKTIFPMVDVGIAPEAGAIALFLIKECNVKTL